MLIIQIFFIVKFIVRVHLCCLSKCKYIIRAITIALVILTSLAACNRESDNAVYPVKTSTNIVQTDYLSPYLLGDTLVFSGSETVSKHGVPTWTSPVEVKVELLPGKVDYLDNSVLTVRQTTTFLQNGEKQIIEQDIWQESNGALFELSNEYGNEYVTGTALEKGLLAIPVPFIDYEDIKVDFFTMYGGHASGPVTQGSRVITLAPVQTIATVLGEYQAYQITHQESYEYLFTYIDNKRGATVVTERNMWISPEKGLLKSNELSRQYSRSGVLQSQSLLELNIERINH